MSTITRPTAEDIRAAIRAAETGNWIDPTDVPNNWECIVYDVDGKRVGDGNALTPGMAMGLAWLCVEAPDALMNAYVEPGSVAFNIPEGFRFELTPPPEEASS
jgi:hypothetical protein